MEQWKGNDLELLAQAEERSEGQWPHRLLFGKGIVAEGEFQPYMSLEDYTAADFLRDPQQATPAAVRFSLATGQWGSGDTYRDLRAMEVKLYTREGNCDLLSLSLPESLWVGGEDFFQLWDELKPSEATGLREQCGYLRYAAGHPQALAGLLRLYGKRGMTAAYDSMESWSSGTLLWRNSKGRAYFVRHRWVPQEPPRYLSENEGEFLCGFDPDSGNRRLYSRLKEGKTAAFELRLQLLPEEVWETDAARYCDPALSWGREEGIQLRAGVLRLQSVPCQAVLSQTLFCCCPDELVSGMELIEGSYLHQMAVITRAVQSARLGRERTAAAINQHRRRQRPAISPRVTRVELCGDTPTEAYYRQARSIWEESSDRERERIANALGQRLLFESETPRRRFLAEMRKIHPQLGKQIENQLIF